MSDETYLTPTQAVDAVREARDDAAARDAILLYGRQEFHYGKEHGLNDAREQIGRAEERARRAEQALRGMVDSHTEGCNDGSGMCCSACAIALSELSRRPPPAATETPPDDLRVLREMASAPPVEGRDFTRMPESDDER